MTGASGMLGRHLLRALADAGMEAVPIGRAGPSGAAWRRWDLLEWQSRAECERLFHGLDAIVHCAAVIAPGSAEYEERDLFDANVRACAMLGDWARTSQVPVVHVSSASVYANPSAVGIHESDPVEWTGLGGAYALSKILAEDVLHRFRARGLRVAVVRPSSLYGTGEPDRRLVSKLLGQAAAGEAITLTPPFDDAVDFVHAADVARAITGILATQCWADYNVASGVATTIGELADVCVAVAGSGRVVRQVGETAAKPPSTRFLLRCDAAERDFGYRSAIDLRTGVRAVLDRHVISVAR